MPYETLYWRIDDDDDDDDDGSIIGKAGKKPVLSIEEIEQLKVALELISRLERRSGDGKNIS